MTLRAGLGKGVLGAPEREYDALRTLAIGAPVLILDVASVSVLGLFCSTSRPDYDLEPGEL